jgi:hypothetical protein
MTQHWLARDFMKHFGFIGFHARSLAGGHDYGRYAIADCGFRIADFFHFSHSPGFLFFFRSYLHSPDLAFSQPAHGEAGAALSDDFLAA